MAWCSKISFSNYLFFCKIDHPNFASHENEIISISWCISKTFYRICGAGVSRSKYMNNDLDLKLFK